MAITKTLKIDGIDVTFRASAAVPRMYRAKFGRDIMKDMANLQTAVDDGNKDASNLDFGTLELFENMAWVMAKHADPQNVPETPDEWLEQFNTFSIYEVLPEIMDLWGMNTKTTVPTSKNKGAAVER